LIVIKEHASKREIILTKVKRKLRDIDASDKKGKLLHKIAK
jgi:hypothetical protein